MRDIVDDALNIDSGVRSILRSMIYVGVQCPRMRRISDESRVVNQ
jgi:hypothetical protein